MFEGRHFDREIATVCVPWYRRFKLKLRDLLEMMGERCRSITHTAIMRRLHHDARVVGRRWNRFVHPAGVSRRVDETSTKRGAERVWLNRAVDRAGNTVDIRLGPRRDVAAASAFFRKAIKGQRSSHGRSLWGHMQHRTEGYTR